MPAGAMFAHQRFLGSAQGASPRVACLRAPCRGAAVVPLPQQLPAGVTTPSGRQGTIAHASPLNKKIDVKEAVGQLRQGLAGHPTVDPAYLNGAAYLKTIGFTNQAEVARVLDIAMNPNSLFLSYGDGRRTKNANARKLDVEEDMRPVVEFLRTRGVAVGEVVKVISAHPPVLSYSVPGRLQPFWDYLALEVGIKDVAAAVVTRPSLLGLDADQNLRKIVGYLQYTETPPETVIKYLLESI